MDIFTASLRELRQQLDQKQLSSEELTDAYLKQIEAHGAAINCYITVSDDRAREQAKAADAVISAGQSNALTGIPYCHKDLFCTQGIRTTAGSKMLDNFIAPYDATVSSKLNAAGAVLLGKANMDEFAMGSSNENSFYGACKNPWSTERVPGGSSGGSAAAVAASLAPIATGTDTGGSIRQPAAFCGLTGVKPTYGRVSRYGMIAFASSLDQGGVLARSADDAAVFLTAMCGHDSQDSTSAKQDTPDFAAALTPSEGAMPPLKIGIPKQYFDQATDPDIASAITAAQQLLEQQGATLVSIDLPNAALSIPTYYVIALAEASSNLSRYDGIRFGHRSQQASSLTELYEMSRTEGFGDEVKRRILLGTFALSAGYYDAYYLQAQKVRQLIKQDFVTAFKEVDCLLAPCTPTTAFQLGSKTADPVAMYLSDIFTVGASLAGLPALSLPVGFDQQQLPIGMQLIGNYFDETTLLKTAHYYQQHSDWHQRYAFRQGTE